MRKPEERIVVKYPHGKDFGRQGRLVGEVRGDIWEVVLDATKSLPAKTTQYNIYWLHKEESLQ